MYGGIVKLVARPNEKSALLDFLRWDADVSKGEPATLRFDIWESSTEPDVVFLYESYADEAAFAAHTANAPFKRFMDEIVPGLAEPPTFIVPFTQSTASNADD